MINNYIEHNKSIDDLNKSLREYHFNKLDNSINGTCVYKITQNALLENEEFIPYDNFLHSTYNFREFALSAEMQKIKIEVSNLGRIKLNDVVAHQFQGKYGWLYVKINNKNIYDVYRLVAETWVRCPVEDTLNYSDHNCWIVHHITDNGFDNRPQNLIWMSWNDHGKLIHKTVKTNTVVKDELYNELIGSILSDKKIEFILDKLEDFYLLKKSDEDDKLVGLICNKYLINIDEFKKEKYV